MLALITSHFNFANYERPRQNLWRFNLQMRSFGYPLYGVEAYLPDQEPFTAGWVNWKQVMVGADQIMFQKEALLNLAETIVPSEYDKIAWLDADIWFQNMKWFETTEKLLDEFKVVQLYDMCYLSSRNGKPASILPSITTLPQRGTPGFAWAANRSFWGECGGLYNAILGGGDRLAALAFMGRTGIKDGSFGSNDKEYRYWQQRVTKWVDMKYSTLPGIAYHEWHGDEIHRAYGTRFQIIRDVDLTLATTKADNRLLKWTAHAPDQLKSSVHQYFINRNEDSKI